MEKNDTGQQKESREVFVWKLVHEKRLITELLVVEPYMHKPNSKERGIAWKQIADNLNGLEDPKFRVTGRAIRDKFKKMLEKFEKNEQFEKTASGIVKRGRSILWSNGHP